MARLLVRRGLAAVLLVGAGLALSGCGYTLGEFSRTAEKPSAKQTVLTEAVMDDSAATVRPAALVEEEVLPPKQRTPAAVAVETVVPPTEYPNINAVPPSSKGKLLTPEEKAKVIANLEALARNQAASMGKGAMVAKAECTSLSAEELRKRKADGRC